MEIELCSCELQLEDGRALRITDARGIEIRCTAGVVWLTEENDGSDHFLASGESHRLRGTGLALIEGIGPARVVITQPTTRLTQLLKLLPAGRARPSPRLCV